MKCDRCGETISAFSTSWFNTDTICMACSEIEKAHPDFAFAKRVEEEMVKRGEYNFSGVGLPADLVPKKGECM
jgi:hypothetical protein